MKNILTIALFLASLISFAQYPALDWVSQASGNRSVFAVASVIDMEGNIYSTGGFEGTADFDPSSGVTNLISEGDVDIFISKHNSQGNLLWAYSFGDNFIDQGYSIAIDANSNVYVTGTFQNTIDFDPGAGVNNVTGLGSGNLFILKLTSSGAFAWVKTYSSNLNIIAKKVAVDNSGDIVLAGSLKGSTTFTATSGEITLTSIDFYDDILIMKLNSSGDCLWAKLTGGGSRDEATAMCLDTDGNIYATGIFQGSVDFDFSSGEAIISSTTPYNSDAFVLKLSSTGDYVWAKNMGGEYGDFGSVIAVDQQGNLFSGGSYQTIADLDPSDEENLFTSAGSFDLYFQKLGPDGEFLWAGSVGGTQLDKLKAISIDETGSVYYLGTFKGTADLNPSDENLSIASNGLDDNFIIKLDNSGAFIWAKTIGGSETDEAYSIQMGANESFYVSGAFRGTCDFDPNEGTTNLTSAGESDLFIAKYAQNSVGLVKLSSTNDFSIFPNPCYELLHIQIENGWGDLKLEIYSITGQLIEKLNLNQGMNTINISEVPKGIYFLSITSKSASLVTQKIVKM